MQSIWWCWGLGHTYHFHDLSWAQFSSSPGAFPGAVGLLSPALHLRKIHWDHTRKCRQKLPRAVTLCRGQWWWWSYWGTPEKNPYFTMQPLCRTSSLCSCLHVDPSEMLSNLFLSVPGLKGVFFFPGLCCYFTPFMTSLTLDFQDRVQCSWSFPEGVSWLVLVSRVVSSNPRGQHEGDKWLMLPLQHPRGWVSAPADLSV